MSSNRMSELERARAEAERSRAEAEALLRLHEVVAGVLAHDLRNPLAAVLMNARMLRDASDERSRGIGRRILTSGDRMSRMIDQILEWTRLRGGGPSLVVELGDCDLRAITDDVVEELRARKADAPIAVDARGDLRGRWDADRLAQVVANLVSNAVEHATRPGAEVTLEGAGAEVRLVVGNEGWIDDQLLPTLFEPFHGRASGARKSSRGLGLGLYITRQIVLAHGGQVELARGPGSRVTFAVTLPRAPA